VKKLKPRKSEPSLREQLSEPLRAFVSDFKINGADALRKVREESPTKYLDYEASAAHCGTQSSGE
jgi:hypothetical protein